MVTPARSYAKTIAIADAAAAGLAVTAFTLGAICFVNTFELFSDDKPDDHPTCELALLSVILAGGTFALASPVIHIAHGRPLAALAAFGLRTVVPGLTLFAAFEAEDGGLVSVAGCGFVAMLGVAALIDWFYLAVPDDSEREPAPRTVAVLPLRDGAGLGVVGRY